MATLSLTSSWNLGQEGWTHWGIGRLKHRLRSSEMRVVCFANSQEGRPEIERGKLPSAEEEQSGFTGTGRECSKNESRSFHQEPNE